MGKRSGYGVLTKYIWNMDIVMNIFRRNGDHFEGHWVDDKREG